MLLIRYGYARLLMPGLQIHERALLIQSELY